MHHPPYRIHKGWPLYTAAGAGLFLVVFSLLGFFRNSNPVTARPKMGPVVEAVYGIGLVTSNRTYNLKIGIMGTLEKRFVEEGDLVKKGTPLVRVMGIPDFRAPFDGTVTAVNFAPGEALFPQMPILTVVDTHDLYLQVILEQEAALRVRPGQTARFSFETLRGKKFQGTVRSVYPAMGQFKVHIDVPDFPPQVLPGMTADTAIEVARRENVLLVPVAAVNSGKLLLLRDGKKHKVDVEIGSTDGEWAEVVSGDVRMTDDVVIPKKQTKSP